MADAAAEKRSYFLVFGALIVLTLVTTGVAFADLGPFNTPLALAIALAKALLVMIFFMHLNHSGYIIRMFAAAAFLWLVHLFVFTLADYLTR
jgi:cytochrome c oxidase subunit IV